MTDNWQDPLSAFPGGFCIAIVRTPSTTSWHFAEALPNHRWRDLSTGKDFTPTHWMPLPKVPVAALAQPTKG